MNKLSSNSVGVRLYYCIFAVSPILVYLIFKELFDWTFQITDGFVFLILIWFSIFSLIIKYSVFDWDLYVNTNGIKLNRLGKTILKGQNINFEISHIPVATAFFFVYKIRFNDGTSYIFKSMPISKLPFDKAFELRASQLKKELLNSLNQQKD